MKLATGLQCQMANESHILSLFKYLYSCRCAAINDNMTSD